MRKSLLFIFAFLACAGLRAQSNLVITEIMYNPPESGADSLEFIELYNNGSNALDLGGYYFNSGVTYTFPTGVSVNPSSYLIVAVDSVAFENTFGMSAYQWTSGGLSNGGEDITIYDNMGNLADSVNYDDTDPWPTEPDGNGASLVLCNPSSDNTLAENWSAATTSTGIMDNGVEIMANPGAGCGTVYPTLYINEVMSSNSSTISDEQGEFDDWFEIYNPNDYAVDISQYYVTDDFTNPMQYQIPVDSSAMVPAHGYLILWADNQLSQPGPLHTTFKFSSSGEEAGLYAPDGSVVDSVTFPALNDDESYGRLPDGDSNWTVFPAGSATPGATNQMSSQPVDSVESNLVITEIMYNPPESGTDSLEFIELYNIGNSALDLSGYYFNSGITYTFPQGMMLDTASYMLLAVDSVAFQNTFGITAYQWTSGGLSNGGEDITIYDSMGNLADSVNYDDTDPWPTEPDGNGASLVLCDPTMPNASADNWSAATTDTGIMIDSIEVMANPGANCTGGATPGNPPLFVNEIMASNGTTYSDEQGEYDDWFEIYNPNNQSVDVSNYYVTDDLTDPTKYQIPTDAGNVIPAHGYLVIWCDDQLSQPGPRHCPFKLSASGEQVGIYESDGMTVVDSVTFPALDQDVSYGRSPDGSDNWVIFQVGTTTPGASNNTSGLASLSGSASAIAVYPNPVNGSVVRLNKQITGTVMNSLGQTIMELKNQDEFSAEGLSSGLYFVRSSNGRIAKFIVE